MGKKKTPLEKLEHPALPEIKEAPPAWEEKFGGKNMLIPTPRLVGEVLLGTTSGELLPMGALRGKLADMASADFSCPLTTGIFLRIVAEAAEAGAPEAYPWWRVVKDDGSLNEKLPGGGLLQAEFLQKEGHQVVARGKKLVVKS